MNTRLSSRAAKPREPLQVILLTGFLGAGKTTLLRHWIKNAQHRTSQLGVVMNDFGSVSVDSLLVAQPDLPLEQIGGGCICCADEQSLADAIAKLIKTRRCQNIVLETSGLADPGATIELLTDPAVATKAVLRGVATVVDAEAIRRNPLLTDGSAALWEAQVRVADWLLLSKCDQLPRAEVERAARAVRRVNPKAKLFFLPAQIPTPAEFLIDAAESRVPAAWLKRRRAGRHIKHLHTSYQTTGFQFTKAADETAFSQFLEQLDPQEVTRAKGFVRLRGLAGVFSFHYTQGRYAYSQYEGDAKPKTVAVFIGPKLDPDKYVDQLEVAFNPPRRNKPARRPRS
jgi:G3E family GTPase